jgi:putative ABC transport system permease protein
MDLILGLIAIAILTGILSGSYPALFLSTFHPIKVIRGNLKSSNRGTWFRKILVVTQFSLTITLFIGTAVVHSQMSHIRGKNLGYDKEHIVVFPLRGDMQKNFETLKNDLLKNTAIINVAGTSSLPTHIGSGTSSAWWEGKEDGVRIQMQVNSVDYDYIDTFKMEMAQGRFFSREYPTDKQAFILNEAAINAMGMESPVGKRFKAIGKEGSIIGIIKDFNYKSLHAAIEPLILVMGPRIYYACVRINADKISAAIKSLEDTWNKLVPGFPFEYSFLDGRINNLYRAEQRMGKVFNSSTLLAIIIACLGLFGMASFTAERRTKEIGIRKVLGASVPSVVSLLSKEYTKLVVISNLIAWPIAYYVMNQWLRGFAYRTNIQIWTLLTAAAGALLIAFLTISYHTIKTATANPVDSLRYE